MSSTAAITREREPVGESPSVPPGAGRLARLLVYSPRAQALAAMVFAATGEPPWTQGWKERRELKP